MNSGARHPLKALANRRRALFSWTAVLAALAMLLPVAASPAHAAGGTLNLSLEAVNPTVLSGEGASFRVQWSCTGAGTCDGARIEVPVPAAMPGSTAFPDGVPLTITSQSGISGGSASVEGEAPDRVLVWTLPAAVNTGVSGTVTFTVTPPNSVTPDGATISPIATFSATGATSVTANADGAQRTVVESEVSLKTVKSRFYPTDVPYVDQQVTYRILVGYQDQFGSSSSVYTKRMRDVCQNLGVQALQNLQLVDTLEPGAEFVSATMGGTYDAGTNTVTWDLGSSISDTAPYGCHLTGGHYEWSAPEVTVTYPSPDFVADPSTTAVTNSVVATANAWGQPDLTLTSDSSTSHGLREGSPGATVAKGPGYDWAIGAPLYRGVPSANNSLYTLTGTSTDTRPARWHFIDMMPCALTSPTDADDIDCATPGFIDLNFSADQYLSDVELHWTTNAGTTGICTLPAGTSVTDTTKRYCVGSTSSQQAPGVPAGEWITKIEVDTEIPAFGGGRIYIHGTPNPDLTADNVDTDYLNPDLDVERTDEHPQFVTVENCPIANTITFENGHVWNPPQPQVRGDNGGICGYRQVMTEPVDLRPVKSIYDPALPSPRPAVPAAQTGDSLTVDLAIQRSNQGPSSVYQKWTFTPTVTDYLPTNLTFVPDSLQIVPQGGATSAALVARLGEPAVDITTVDFGGEDRQKITITFPDADIEAGMQIGNPAALARFEVRIKDGVPAGTYANDYLLIAEEAGPGIGETYLNCSTGTMVDADLKTTTDRSVAIGCLARASYTVLPTPAAKVEKSVQGTYDDDAVQAPGIGVTTVGGDAVYRLNVENSGSVDIRNVVAYDVLPRIDDTLILPAASGESRDSEFPVRLTGPVTSPAGASVQYSTSENPCRGDLAGTGGGSVASAPVGCDNDWAAAPPGADYSQVTAIRVDFGGRVFPAGESAEIRLDVQTSDSEGAIDGVAWNNAAVAAREASSGSPTLPVEQTPVGLKMIPDLSWAKVDRATGNLLDGSVWSLAPVDGHDVAGFPLSVEDCTSSPCDGPDRDPVAGRFTLAGIPWGQYELTEVAAPTGYVLLEEPIEVRLTPERIDESTHALDLGDIENRRLQSGEWSLSKTSDPASGSVVAPGDTITYTLTAVNASGAAVADVVVTDDLSDALSHAKFDEFVNDDDGKATRGGSTITWNVGELADGETRTVSYSVVINEDAKGVTIRNVVTGEGEVPPADCTPAKPCDTTHETPDEPVSPNPGGFLPTTGGPEILFGGVALCLLFAGAVALAWSRQTERRAAARRHRA